MCTSERRRLALLGGLAVALHWLVGDLPVGTGFFLTPAMQIEVPRCICTRTHRPRSYLKRFFVWPRGPSMHARWVEVIDTGVYRYSRNPIYLGMALAQGGLAIAGGSLAALATLGLSLLAIRTYVIAREERYLEGKFGKVYSDYKQRVRRWI